MPMAAATVTSKTLLPSQNNPPSPHPASLKLPSRSLSFPKRPSHPLKKTSSLSYSHTASTAVPRTFTASTPVPGTVTAPTPVPGTVTAPTPIPGTVTASTRVRRTVTASTPVRRTVTASTPVRRTVTASTPSPLIFRGPCYVLADNIDTDQIIPAEHLTLVPSKPDEYRKLGSLALVGLPSDSYPTPFVEPGDTSTIYPIIIAGANFGCGSSREHAPVALGAAGAGVVVAESYARIFFRNSVATGEIYPVESEEVGIWKECTIGDLVTVDLGGSRMINHSTGKEYRLKPIGDAGPVIEAGGIFAYARKTGMIGSAMPE